MKAEKSRKTIAITRRIQLNFNTDDPELRKEYWQTLYKWQQFTFNAANKIMSELYLQDNIREMIYLEDDFKIKLAARFKKNPDNKAEMIDGDPDGVLVTSRVNSTYQYISKKVKGEIPMSIITALNTQLHSLYSKEQKKYYTGEISLRNYKRDIPIPIEVRHMQNLYEADQHGNYAFTLYGLPFKTYFGIDKSGNKVIFNRSLKGEYKLCNSSIQLKNKRVWLLAVFEFEKQELALSTDMQAVASLSFDAPIIMQVGTSQIQIGDKEAYLYRRLSIQNQLRKAQRSAKFGRVGHGRTMRMQSTERFREWEKDYISTMMHKYSNMLVKLCIQNKCGTLVLKDQTQKEEEAKENPFVLRNWSYANLKDKILYKAAKVGLEVVVE